MADDDQQPGPSRPRSESETPVAVVAIDSQDDSGDDDEEEEEAQTSGEGSKEQQGDQQQQQQQQQQTPTRNRKRKHSTKRGSANKKGGPSEEELDAEKLKFLLEPVLSALRALEVKNELEAMRTLINTLQPSQHEIEMALNKVKKDLDRVLAFPNNSYCVYDFGSIKSGLAFRDSDLDFYVHYERNSENRNDQTKLIHVIHSRMMRDKTFHTLVKIIGAKVPLLRAVHGPTNLTCDINFSNARGCYNSKFIYALTKFDSRIHKLAIIIKFWAKCAFLLTNHRQMNTYCIIMMLIFYLQTKKLPLLPSVQDLQKGIPRVNYGPWNLGYPREIIFQSMNRESIRQLLTAFFKYYATFEYDKYLISPYVGRRVTVDEMKQQKVRELQPYYRAEQQQFPQFNYGTLLHIQDPFELNMNVGGVLNSAQHFEQFKLSFKTAHEVCLATIQEPFAKVLEEVFTKTKKFSKPPKNVPRPKNGTTNSNATGNGGETPSPAEDNGKHWRICRLLPIEYELFMVRQILLVRNTDKDAIITERQIKDMWADCLLDFIEDILSKIYLLKVEPLKDADRCSNIPPSVKQDDIRTFQMVSERQVIFKRPRLQISNEEELENEIAISKARWQANRPLVFNCRVDLFKTNDDAIELHIPDQQRKNGALRVFIETCFLTQIRNCIKGYLKVMLAKAEERAKADRNK
ncbi:uncharacterized protein LOC120424383 [Culex pipiens pallens]|uniref:uncharacterized protein LOC120424383 n=1 Tax=Culex pipiens pallens TaxID=42434 RepID=UPI00195332FA|nr:uncharacterized protein LOC120424383 [Culex pipiens pallens]XP_039444417.1 uncharacterized protein LOC120424383 [Culex pipiens pallens]